MGVFKLKGRLLILSVLILSLSAFAQTTVDRQAYAAGRFYTSDSAKLVKELEYLFSLSEKGIDGEALAVISPHAGFQYSGEVAATGFNQIDPEKQFENIFLIGSSHTMQFDGISVYSQGDYITPLGKVKVNKELAKELIGENKYISFIKQAHLTDHILENQLPFLQYYLKNTFQIVPIIIGTDDEKALKSLASTLKPFLNEKNLFVISADFSHYPNYKDACVSDSATAEAILTNDATEFEETLKENKKANWQGHVTSTCGSTAIETLLYITQNNIEAEYLPLKYMNSGDVPIGDKNRVVGYFSIVLVKDQAKQTYDYLTEKDKKDLLSIARLTIEEYINKKIIPELDPEQFSENLKQNSGAFVTLNKSHNLRGCIGRFTSDQALYLVVQQMAIAAATNDYRFQTVRPPEINLLEIEVSVLTPLTKINSTDEIELGRDGIYIIKGKASGTFLPQVADETGWTKEEFLGHCARDKAGIGWEGWKDADIYIYQAIVFSENDFN